MKNNPVYPVNPVNPVKNGKMKIGIPINSNNDIFIFPHCRKPLFGEREYSRQKKLYFF